jgi:DNA-binding response OmpR family regulator
MATPMSPGTIPPLRILVVDDEPMVASTIKLVLEFKGHQVDVAEDAETAVTLFEPGKYGLVITDLKLHAMDGLDLAREIRKRAASQPIILLTAYAESIKGDKSRLANVDCVVGKPFSVQQLQDALSSVVGAK